MPDLTPAEQRVMNGICEGLSSAQIAMKFGRSPETIRAQTISLYRKLGVGSRSAVVALRVKALEAEIRRLRRAMRAR